MNRILLLIFTAATFNCAYTQSDSTDYKIRKMMDVLGSTESMKVVGDNLIRMQEKQSPILKESVYWKEFKNDIYQGVFEDLLDSLVPIYKKHLTISEIEAITDFYSGPSGQSMVKKFPLIAIEAMKVGEAWGEEIVRKIVEEKKLAKQRAVYTPETDCSKFKTGKFKYIYNSDTEILVDRTANYQEEITNGKVWMFHIEWISSCEYKIWDVMDDNDYSDVKPLFVTIYETNDKGYKYTYTIAGKTELYTGEMILLE